MKFTVLLLLGLTCAMACGQKTRFGQGSSQTSPFAVAVHVTSSKLVHVCASDLKGSSCGWAQELAVTIDGRKLTLEQDRMTRSLLRTGDYHARIVKDDTATAYEYQRMYEFQFADGKTKRYMVIGEAE